MKVLLFSSGPSASFQFRHGRNPARPVVSGATKPERYAPYNRVLDHGDEQRLPGLRYVSGVASKGTVANEGYLDRVRVGAKPSSLYPILRLLEAGHIQESTAQNVLGSQ